MANRQTTASVSKQQLTFQQNETDSPIIPVAQLERLHTFKPDAVDWVIQQTQIEAEHRRAETKRINTFVFAEHLIGQLCALLIGLAGIAGGAWIAINGEPAAGATIATAAITGLAVVFIKGRRQKKE
jgi:uncharacterized membrane protein